MKTSEDSNVRLRRTKSVNSVEDIKKCEEVLRKSQPDRPCHKYQDSLFSWSSGFEEFTGFVNWAFLLITIGGVRLLLENVLKYGIRIDTRDWFSFIFGIGAGDSYITFFILAYSVIPILICLFVERGVSKDIVGENIALTLQIINMSLVFILPVILITVNSDRIALSGSMIISFVYCIIFLKLWSYIQVNRWCRASSNEKRKQRVKSSISVNAFRGGGVGGESKEWIEADNCQENLRITLYPDNLNVKDIAYFMFIPTLCYELNFPRTDRIRKRFLLKRILELMIGLHVIGGLFQQWIIPSVKVALIPFSNMDIMNCTERLLKLSIPNHLMWLIMFYLAFHSYFNILGEISHFADRNFYLDWWNANNIAEFWKKWNIPVHKWALRHVYLPMIEIGYSRMTASVVVFFVSAFLHEFLVSVPLQTFRSWAFIGMMAQIPLSQFSIFIEHTYGPRWGNIIVWLSLILGQPLCIMMYYHDYIVTHYGQSLISEFGYV